MFEQLKKALKQDNEFLCRSARSTRHLVQTAAADRSSWAIAWGALTGHPPILSDAAAQKIRSIQHFCGAGTALLGLYAGVMSAMGMDAVVPGAAILACSLMLSAIFAGLMLRAPRVPESHRLEFQPAETLPPIESGRED